MFASKFKLTGKFVSFILAVTLVTLLIGSSLMYYKIQAGIETQIGIAEESLRAGQHSSEESLLNALNSKADIIGRFMAKTGIDFYLSQDLTMLETFQQEAVSDQDVAYALYLDTDGSPLLGGTIPDKKDDITEKRYSVTYESDALGHVALGISKKSVQQGIIASNARIDTAITKVKDTGQKQTGDFFTIMALNTFAIVVAITGIIFFLFKMLVIKPLDESTLLMQELSKGKGDLTVTLPVTQQDEIGILRGSANTFLEQLRKMIHTIKKEVDTLFNASGSLQGFSTQLRNNSEEQSQMIHSVVSAVTEMTSSIQNVASNAVEAAKAANDGKEEAYSGRQVLKELVDSIHMLASQVEMISFAVSELGNDSERVGVVLNVISDISNQTNLLALNAAIEAARAGENGRGFAVVADEVRKLASSSQDSAEEIRRVILGIQERTKNAVEVMNQSQGAADNSKNKALAADQALERIIETVEKVTIMGEQIATAVEEQSMVTEDINTNMENLSRLAENTVEGAEQTSTSSNDLTQLAERLHDQIGQFKT